MKKIAKKYPPWFREGTQESKGQAVCRQFTSVRRTHWSPGRTRLLKCSAKRCLMPSSARGTHCSRDGVGVLPVDLRVLPSIVPVRTYQGTVVRAPFGTSVRSSQAIQTRNSDGNG